MLQNRFNVLQRPADLRRHIVTKLKKINMKIEQIIYDTARNLNNVEDKLSIAALFLFCDKLGREQLAELLYTNYVALFIEALQDKYRDAEINFSIKTDRKEVMDVLLKTIEVYRIKNDSDGFLKAVFEEDPFAISILKISSRF